MDELERIGSLIPLRPTEDRLEELLDLGFLSKNVLIYRVAFRSIQDSKKKEKVVECFCSHCEKTFDAEYVRNDCCDRGYTSAPFGFKHAEYRNTHIISRMDTLCPICGEPVTARHIGSFQNDLYVDAVNFVTFEKVENYLFQILWRYEKNVSKENEIKYFLYKYAAQANIEGKWVHWVGGVNYLGSWGWLPKWEIRKKFYDRISDDNPYTFIPTTDLIENTNACNSALGEFLKVKNSSGCAHGYLKMWHKFPNVENLVVQGAGQYLCSLIESLTTGKGYYYNPYIALDVRKIKEFINVKKAKPHEMLGVEKSEFKILKGYSFKAFEFYKKIGSLYKIKLSPELVEVAEKCGPGQILDLIECCEELYGFKLPIVRFLNYMQKQTEKSIHYVNDYWRYCIDLYKEVPENIRYPKSIVMAHDKMMNLKKENESRILNEKISKIAENKKMLCFEDPETHLLIRPAASHQELINEGKKLNHCVASYAKNVAEGKTLILFIRDIEKPDEPYFTLEFKKNKVEQNRGRGNCAREERVVLFEKKWLEYLKTLKGEKKNGKQPITAQKRTECCNRRNKGACPSGTVNSSVLHN